MTLEQYRQMYKIPAVLRVSHIYVVPTGMEEAPKAALNIHCLQLGGGVALTRTINLIPPPRGDGSARA